MIKHAHSIILPVDVDQAYDLVAHYFPQQGYSIKSTARPTSFIFERGNTMSAHNFETIHLILGVSINKTSIGTTVLCDYETTVWTWSPKFTDNMKNEVEGIASMMSQLRITPTSPNVSNVQQPAVTEDDDDRDRKCVKCHRQIPWDANICPYCGQNYQKTKSSQEITKHQSPGGTKFCPFCGTYNSVEFNFCSSCKNPLPEVKK